MGILALLLLLTALSAASIWRGWRDPVNWRVDPIRGRLAFNHWKELALGVLVCTACAVMMAVWVFA